MSDLIYYFVAGIGAAVVVYVCGEFIHSQTSRAIPMVETHSRAYENPWEYYMEPTSPPPSYSKYSLD